SAKQQDLAEFDGTSLTGLRKNVAALTYAMDRAVGNVLNRIDDPNGDGDTEDSIADNTIVVFVNDNGGRLPLDGQSLSSNGPLKGFKGDAWEGGIRIPYMIKAPGLAPSVFDQPVSTIDLY